MKNNVIFFILTLTIGFLECESGPTPVILWHGMGDNAGGNKSINQVKKIIEQHVNGVYVKSLEIGKNSIADTMNGYFLHPDKQILEICEKIKNDKKLSNGYNAIGFSQGGQFLRGLAQRCPSPQMKNLITFGAQHQGIFGLPNCPSISSAVCSSIRDFLSKGAYKSWIQKTLVQATYWHDPLNEDAYRSGSTFLADINNELNTNRNYITNLQNLEKFVMVKFLNDTMVQPLESSWFEYYEPGQDKIILPLNQSKIYLEEKLGLREMDLNGKLVFLEKEGDHLNIGQEWFINNIIPYLKN